MPPLVSHPDNRQLRVSVQRGIVVSTLCSVAGATLLAMGDGAAILGLTMFLVLPAATGFTTALTVPYCKAVAISLLITAAVCLGGSVLFALEGLVCVAMASPLLLAAAMIGAALGKLIKHLLRRRNYHSAALAPLLAVASIFAAGKTEDHFGSKTRLEVVTSNIIVDASPDDVWQELMQFDQVNGATPLLMKMGLPIPQSCSTDGSGVGSMRVCHFDSGYIRERVTTWEPPYRLELAIEEVQLPGRHWLGFEQATYTLKPLEHGRTLVTRSTTITSMLRPAWYWRHFERLGARTEHEYILHSLKADLSTKND